MSGGKCLIVVVVVVDARVVLGFTTAFVIDGRYTPMCGAHGHCRN